MIEQTTTGYRVRITLRYHVKGSQVTITDKADQPIGDACAAKHQLAIDQLLKSGGRVLERRATEDSYERPEERQPAAVTIKNKATNG